MNKTIKLTLTALVLIYGINSCGGSDTPNNIKNDNSITHSQNPQSSTSNTPTKNYITGTQAFLAPKFHLNANEIRKTS